MRNGIWKVKVVEAGTPELFEERLEEGFREGYLQDGVRHINSILLNGIWFYTFVQVMTKYIADPGLTGDEK